MQVIKGVSALVLLTLTGGIFAGCATYATPGQAADMRLFGGGSSEELAEQTDAAVQRSLDLKPLASFPVHLGVARVQAAGYRSYTARGHGGRGSRYSVVTTRDIEREEDFQKLKSLPLIEAVAPMNRLLLSEQLDDDRDVRHAAARLHANMLLIYTFDTNIHIGDSDSPLDVVTLGFLPSRQARVTTTASAVLMDTRNGYVYGLAEASATHEQPANTWTTELAVDDARQKAEREALTKLIDDFANTWQGVVEQYAQPAERSSATPAERASEPLVIEIVADGSLRVDNQAVAADQLKKTLAPLAQQAPTRVVTVKADRETNYGRMVQVLDQAKSAGFTNIQVVATAPRPQ